MAFWPFHPRGRKNRKAAAHGSHSTEDPSASAPVAAAPAAASMKGASNNEASRARNGMIGNGKRVKKDQNQNEKIQNNRNIVGNRDPSVPSSSVTSPVANTTTPAITVSPTTATPSSAIPTTTTTTTTTTPANATTTTTITASPTPHTNKQTPIQPSNTSHLLPQSGSSANMNFHLPNPRGGPLPQPLGENQHPSPSDKPSVPEPEQSTRSPLSEIPPNSSIPSSTGAVRRRAESSASNAPAPANPAVAADTTAATATSDVPRRKSKKQKSSRNDYEQQPKHHHRKHTQKPSAGSATSSQPPRRSASWSCPSTSRGTNPSPCHHHRHQRFKSEAAAGANSLKHDAASSIGYSPDIDMEAYTFRINAFDVLTPRPLVRCSGIQNPDGSEIEHPHPHPPASPPCCLRPPSYTRDKGLVIPPVRDEDRRMRIKELADNLDAGALRELMERDQRRKELKRQNELEKKERKLQRRADKEKRKRERQELRDQEQQRQQQEQERTEEQGQEPEDGQELKREQPEGSVQPEPQQTQPPLPTPDSIQEEQETENDREAAAANTAASTETAPVQPFGSARNRSSIRFVNPQAPQRYSLRDVSQSVKVSVPKPNRASDPQPALNALNRGDSGDSTNPSAAAAPAPPAVGPASAPVTRSTTPSSNPSAAFSSKIASFFRRGSRLRRKNRQLEQQRRDQPSETSTLTSSFSTTNPPPTTATTVASATNSSPPQKFQHQTPVTGFSVPSRESFKNSQAQNRIITPPLSIDRSYMTPSPSTRRTQSKFTELLDYPSHSENITSRIPSSEAVNQYGVNGIASSSLASVTEIRSSLGMRLGDESSSNHVLGDRSAVASPEPITEENESHLESEAEEEQHQHHQQQIQPQQQEEQPQQPRHISDSQDSDIHAPNNEKVALARSLASIDSEGSWFSPRVSRSLSVKTARTQAQIDRYRAGSGTGSHSSKDGEEGAAHKHSPTDTDVSDAEEDDFARNRMSGVMGEVNFRAGAKGHRIVVHPSTHIMAHAATAEFASTDNFDDCSYDGDGGEDDGDGNDDLHRNDTVSEERRFELAVPHSPSTKENGCRADADAALVKSN